MARSPALPKPIQVGLHVLGFTQIAGWGTTFYTPAVLAGPVIADTGWSRTLVFGAFSLSLLLGAVLARPAGRVIDKYGGRLAMGGGSVLAAAGLLVAAVAPHLGVYFLAWVIIGAAMRFTLYEAAFATLTAAAGRDARRAISYLTLYGGVASTVFWPIGHALVEAVGWRWTFVVFALVNLLFCAPLHAFTLPRAGAALTGPGADDAAAAGGPALTGAARTYALIMLTLTLALYNYVSSALSAHLVDMLVALGLAAGTAVSIAALRGIGQVAGRLWEILFLGQIRPATLAVIAVGLTPLAFLALLPGVGFVTAIAFTFMLGASMGLVTIVRGVVPLLLFGPVGYGALIGTMTAPSLVTGALAPMSHAATIEWLGHEAALAILAAGSLVALVAIIVLAWRLAPKPA
ncbi:MAG: MFS transporter [Alphaproteobacteria bacterium]|nr:MFS transporter [Alphaproteobacteria bacterium]